MAGVFFFDGGTKGAGGKAKVDRAAGDGARGDEIESRVQMGRRERKVV